MSSEADAPKAAPTTRLGKWVRSWFAKKPKEVEMKNVPRELCETVVFVLVLVLMLQRFVAEAFVIPTGSMAETLYGDHVTATCRMCGHKSVLNSSADDRGFPPQIHAYSCSNCGYMYVPDGRERNRAEDDDYISSVWSGDRVLVLKPAYHAEPPHRFDVPVFKWPVEPFSAKERIPTNYIKRLVGLPGETIGVFDGNLFRCTALQYADRTPAADPNDLWRYENMYASDPEAIKAFKGGQFEIIRKKPGEILAQRILVFDMDKLPAKLSGVAKTRWHPQPGSEAVWKTLESGFKHDGDLGWLRFHNLKRDWTETPDLDPTEIKDFVGYNRNRNGSGEAAVTDLIVECRADFQTADASVTLELNKGSVRYQAVFEGGTCALSATEAVEAGEAEKPVSMAKQPTSITGAGRHELRFANVDCRLTVWVDDKPLDFGDAANYRPILVKSSPQINDRLQPARIGAKGTVSCEHIRLWRDIYYVCGYGDHRRGNPLQDPFFPTAPNIPNCADMQTFYVQPGHFLCFGDNSSSSLDGRMWGLVPERLLLGKAVLVYYPPGRFGIIK